MLRVEMTVGKGDVPKDVAFRSILKAGIGGLLEGEISGRIATQGLVSIDSKLHLQNLNFPHIGSRIG